MLQYILKLAYGHLPEGPVSDDPGTTPTKEPPFGSKDPREKIYTQGTVGKVWDGRGSKKDGEPDENKEPSKTLEQLRLRAHRKGELSANEGEVKEDYKLKDNDQTLSRTASWSPARRYLAGVLEKCAAIRIKQAQMGGPASAPGISPAGANLGQQAGTSAAYKPMSGAPPQPKIPLRPLPQG
jgi:hypothetical protein